MRTTNFFVALLLVSAGVHGEQKNVQLLTGMSDVQLRQTMNFIRASLGVHCDFCHVVDDKTGWDFASDAKQTKRKARQMIQMVEQINLQNFEGSPAVACNTCHRGSTRPISLPTLPQTPPPFPTPIRSRPTLPSRDDVVARYSAAIGDASSLRTPRVLKGIRESWDGSKTPFEAQMADGKWRIVVEGPDGRREQIITDVGGWIRTAKGVEKVSSDDLERFQMLTNAFEPVSPFSIPAGARVVDKEKIGDRDAVIVAAAIDDHRRQRLFFDAGTGLLIRRQILTRVAIGEIPQQIDFDDYRDVGGVKFPFTIRVSLVDPWSSVTRRYTEVQLGAIVEESVFSPPGGTQF